MRKLFLAILRALTRSGGASMGKAKTSFERALAHTLGIEGDYSDDPDDRGGKTRYGITEALARRHGYKGLMRDFPLERAKLIYRAEFWDRNKLDKIAEWSEPAALEMFDTGVNTGWRTAARFLQRALNAMNRNATIYDDLKVDGYIGPIALRALFFLPSAQDKRTVLKMLDSQQGVRYMTIMDKKPNQEKYARGWFIRVGVGA